MPVFQYRARDRSGKAIEDRLEAPTLQIAGDQLRRLGYLPISIEERRDSRPLPFLNRLRQLKKVRLEDLVIFSQQLSTLYKAGLPLLLSLSNLKEQVEDKRLRFALKQVCNDVEGGNPLFASLANILMSFLRFTSI